MYTSAILTAVETPPGGISHAAAAIIMILVVLGFYGLFRLGTKWSLLALILLIGIIVVNWSGSQGISTSIRDSWNEFAVEQGWWEASGDFTLTLLLILALLLAFLMLSRAKPDKRTPWWIVIAILLLLFFTISWAADAIIWFTEFASEALQFLLNLGG